MEISGTEIPGLYYIANCIPANVAELVSNGLIETFITNGPAFTVGNGRNSRRVMHYGYEYNYKTGDVTQPAPPFPPWVNALVDIIRSIGIGSENGEIKLDQCLINKYEAGQGIAAHIDSLKYGEFIYCFTFASGAHMEFTHPKTNVRVVVYTEPNSLYIMSGDARYVWRHEMRPVKTDIVMRYDEDEDTYNEEKIKRGVRTSITFRSLDV